MDTLGRPVRFILTGGNAKRTVARWPGLPVTSSPTSPTKPTRSRRRPANHLRAHCALHAGSDALSTGFGSSGSFDWSTTTGRSTSQHRFRLGSLANKPFYPFLRRVNAIAPSVVELLHLHHGTIWNARNYSDGAPSVVSAVHFDVG